MTQENKIPSPELLSLIKAAAQSLLGFGELWNSIKMKGKDEGFSEKELQDILRPLLKPQLNKDQIYYLFHTEEKKVQNKEHYDSTNRINPKVLYKQDIEQSKDQFETDTKLEQELDRIKQESPPEPEEEPTEVELLKIENEQLKDALHKTEQFKPATAFEEPAKGNVKTMGFEFLREMADGIHSFYYDAYGIDLFKNRELSQLKNSGVKTFKRLYFEV